MNREKLDFAILFGPENNIKYYQDFGFFRNIPYSCYFDVTFNGDSLILTAPGYGKRGDYGNGSIIVKIADLFKTSEDKTWADDWF